MRKAFSAAAILLVATIFTMPGAGAVDDCSIYVTPVITADESAYPGDQITVDGSGFAPGDSIVITINGSDVGNATADASGSFSATVTVPAGTAPGTATVVATSDGCDQSASTTTEVLNTDGPSPNPSPNPGPGVEPAAQVGGVSQTQSSAALASTGSNSTGLVAAAVGLTGIGAGLLLVARRRRNVEV